MSRQNKNMTLTPNQEKYVKANYKRMTIKEMARNLSINIGLVNNNMRLMGLSKTATRAQVIELPATKAGYFDIDAYGKLAII